MRQSKVKGIRWDKCIFTDLSGNMIDCKVVVKNKPNK